MPCVAESTARSERFRGVRGECVGLLDFTDCPADNDCIGQAEGAKARAALISSGLRRGETQMKRTSLAALIGLALLLNAGCQHCRWTIFPDVTPCGPGPGCGERYWGDWRACPDPCDQCANWVGHGHAGYNKWGRRDDGGGCVPECQTCGESACTTCGATEDCGCGDTAGSVTYSE